MVGPLLMQSPFSYLFFLTPKDERTILQVFPGPNILFTTQDVVYLVSKDEDHTWCVAELEKKQQDVLFPGMTQGGSHFIPLALMWSNPSLPATIISFSQVIRFNC